MRTIETKLYTFEELSEEAKQRAIEKNRYFNVEDSFWHECVYETFKDQAEEAGFSIATLSDKRGKGLAIYFSGFWSQGDGAMFEYDHISDELKNEFIEGLKLSPMRKTWLKNQAVICGSCRHLGHYYHENCASHSIDFESSFQWSVAINFHNWIESFAADFEDFVISKYKDLCRDLYRQLEKEYEYMTSDESVSESLISNEYEFTEDGMMS